MTKKKNTFDLKTAHSLGGLDLVTAAFMGMGYETNDRPPRPEWLPDPLTADLSLTHSLQKAYPGLPQQCWRNSFINLNLASALAAEKGLGQVFYCEGIGAFPLSNTGSLFPAEHGFIMTEAGGVIETTWDVTTAAKARYYVGLKLTAAELLDQVISNDRVLPLSVYDLSPDSAAYRLAVDAAYYDCFGVFPTQIAAAFVESMGSLE